jgi:hypothetical protein
MKNKIFKIINPVRKNKGLDIIVINQFCRMIYQGYGANTSQIGFYYKSTWDWEKDFEEISNEDLLKISHHALKGRQHNVYETEYTIKKYLSERNLL